MQSADDRLFRIPPRLAPLRSSDRDLLCQTSSLLLPAATAFAPATFGLSASHVWPSFLLAKDRLEYPPCGEHPPHVADAVSSTSSGSLRLRLLADQLHSVRSPKPKPWPLPLCTANTFDAFLNLFRRTRPLYVFSTCNRAAPQFSSYVLPALFHLELSA